MLINGGAGANGARILGAKSVELMFKNHLPEGQCILEMENTANSQAFGLMSGSLPIKGMGYGLGGTVPLGDRHQVEDGCLAMPEGSYSWAGIAGTDVIIDPANDLAMLFMTQVPPAISLSMLFTVNTTIRLRGIVLHMHSPS